MTANEIATLATGVMPYVTAAVSAYGGAVLTKARDKSADATVNLGVRILQRVFHQQKAKGELPEPLADIVAHPGDEMFRAGLMAAIYKALDRDATMLAEVRGMLTGAPGTTVTQHVHADRDAYVSGRDMYIDRGA